MLLGSGSPSHQIGSLVGCRVAARPLFDLGWRGTKLFFGILYILFFEIRGAGYNYTKKNRRHNPTCARARERNDDE